MYVDVILPLPIADVFTYSVPESMRQRVGVGFRVIVPFGSRKFYTAVVRAIHSTQPPSVETKEIHSLIDAHPIVNECQLKFWEWISFYYICPIGDVYKAALPSKLRLESETYIQIANPEFTHLSVTEKRIIAFLEQNPSEKISVIEKAFNIKNILPAVYSLYDKGAISVSEKIEQKFAPKTEKRLRVCENVAPQTISERIGKAKKQKALFDELLHFLNENQQDDIAKKHILDFLHYSASSLKGLINKGILIEFSTETERIATELSATRTPFALNSFQQKALDEIVSVFATQPTCLLHGVTSGGKTEIYIHLIQKILSEGKQVLYLVPEIALTTQLTSRLQSVFGNRLGIYHSKINDNERTEIWHKMLSHEPYDIIIGVRSSLFLPYQQLGLIVVDEEHEPSYKQQEPSPRYHARDTAIVLAQLFSAKTLLGSATPSLESYYNASIHKFGFVTLDKRFDEIQLPEILIEDTKELRRKKKMKSLLAPVLIQHISQALENGEQAILFRNRRGYAPVMECTLCAWTPKCKRCDVSLTYHKYRNRLICHYCNTTYTLPEICPECGEKSLKMLGQGTEQLEEEVARLFPEARVARMDTDTMRKKSAYEQIIEDFQQKRIDILVGTQMIAKGLDFDNVRVVGIISADSLLNYPDFRSYERAYQLMTQAAGRAGRKNRQGVVVIQTADAQLPIYQFVKQNNYGRFFETQMQERKLFHYPPFCRIIRIIFKDRDEQKVEKAARFMAENLRKSLFSSVLGPNKPVVGKVKLQHIREILLKVATGFSPHTLRHILKAEEKELRKNASFKYITLYYDVDSV